MTRVFLSYPFGPDGTDQTDFVTRVLQVSYWLKVQGIQTFCAVTAESDVQDNWLSRLPEEVNKCDALAFFQGTRVGDAQDQEARIARAKPMPLVFIKSASADVLERAKGTWEKRVGDVCDMGASDDPHAARKCAQDIVERLKSTGLPVDWYCDDDLPIVDPPLCPDCSKGFPFAHEKQILDEYTRNDRLAPQLIERGCPPTWPQPRCFDPDGSGNSAEARRTGAKAGADVGLILPIRHHEHPTTTVDFGLAQGVQCTTKAIQTC